MHIDDLIDAYIFFLNKNINSNIYNIGFENLSIIEIAKKISKIISSKITIKKRLYDPRSYNLDSSKLLKTGFRPKKKIDNAIQELSELYKQKVLKDKPNYHSIKWLKKFN